MSNPWRGFDTLQKVLWVVILIVGLVAIRIGLQYMDDDPDAPVCTVVGVYCLAMIVGSLRDDDDSWYRGA
jgi:hypothetical protein